VVLDSGREGFWLKEDVLEETRAGKEKRNCGSDKRKKQVSTSAVAK
jgi:hypothetical protein